MDYLALKSELAADPAALGYDGKTDAECAALLNDPTKRTRNRQYVNSAEVFEALDPTEYAALSAGNKAAVNLVLGLGERIAVNGANTRAVLLAAFGAGTTTRVNLTALAKEAISRAAELGFGSVEPRHVTKARAL